MKLSEFKFISKQDAAALLGVSVTTLNRRRKGQAEWHENVHYTRRDSGQYEYNETLLQAWHDREIHPHGYINALQEFQMALETDQKRRKAR